MSQLFTQMNQTGFKWFGQHIQQFLQRQPSLNPDNSNLDEGPEGVKRELGLAGNGI